MADIEVNERVATVANALISRVTDTLLEHDVTPEELMKFAMWSTTLEPFEHAGLPLIFFEGPLVEHGARGLKGTRPNVQGPYHREDHLELKAPYRMPMRPEEPGTPFLMTARFEDDEGTPIPEVRADVWHSANDGTYSGFNPNAPEGNLRGIMRADENGVLRFGTIRPAPYEALHEGRVYDLLHMMGLHAWRPAHFHFKLERDGFKPLTTQLYFEGDWVIDKIGDSVVGGVKDDLIMPVVEGSDEAAADTYGLTLPYQASDFTFVLRRAT